MDIKIFVDTDDDVRIIRRIKAIWRSVAGVLIASLSNTRVVKPMYHQFIEPTKRYADVIIPGGRDQYGCVIDLITTKIEKILNEAREGK